MFLFTNLKIFCTLIAILIPSFAAPLSEVVIRINFEPQDLGFKSPHSDNCLVTSLSQATTPNISLRDIFVLKQLPVKASPHYTAGQRVPGDVLVGTKKDYIKYDTPQYIQLKLTLPPLAGKKITFVEIDVEQSSNEGRAYITDGGIGQDHIQIVVEASDITYFGYTAVIYGK